MQNTESSTKTFSPPEGGYTAKQVAEYEALKTTEAELKEFHRLSITGHTVSWASIAQAGDGRSFNEIFKPK